jgi:hypothetical protein
MGNGQPGLSDYFTPIKEDVNVERARPFELVPRSVILSLDIETGSQQFPGGKPRIRLNDCVQEPGLVENFSRLGGINGSALDNVDTMHGQSAYSGAEVLFTIANVGSKRQINDHRLIMERSIL